MSVSKTVWDRVMLWLSFLAAMCIVTATGLVVWFYRLDPVVPRITFESGRVGVAYEPGTGKPVAIESVRVVCLHNSAGVSGRLYAEIVENPPDPLVGPAISLGGTPIYVEERRFVLGFALLDLKPGCWERKRRWALPVGLERKYTYRYEPHFEVCNVVGKCLPVPWPGLPLPPEAVPASDHLPRE